MEPIRQPGNLNPEVRRRIEVQGYAGLDDATLLKLDPWIRLVPFVTGLMTAFSTLLVAPVILMVLAIVTAVSAILPWHPGEIIYNTFIRHLEKTPALPRTPGRRRVVYLVWALLIGAAALCLETGYLRTGISLGWFSAALISLQASQQQCLLCEILDRLSPVRSGRRP